MLKEHLLPRVQELLQINEEIPVSHNLPIFFKSERMYSHKIVRFNYTTYDIRRAQDVVNPGSSHCNVMLLSPATSTHPYLYARVLGIYHANVVYTGPGSLDYTPHRMDFLWVRWYDYREGENEARLGQLSFPPITSERAFGFVDPANVVRGCHIIPRFSQGKRHPSGVGFSKLARDSRDWVTYYISRYIYFLEKCRHWLTCP